MAISRITSNQIKGLNHGGSSYITVHTDQTHFVNLNGGTNPANSAGETITAMHISKVICAANGCGFDVFRGANLVGSFSGVNTTDYQEENIRLEAGGDPQSNLVITKVGVGSGTLAVKLHKQSGS